MHVKIYTYSWHIMFDCPHTQATAAPDSEDPKAICIIPTPTACLSIYFSFVVPWICGKYAKLAGATCKGCTPNNASHILYLTFYIVNRHVDTQLSYMAVGFQSRDQHTRTLRSDTDGFDPNRD